MRPAEPSGCVARAGRQLSAQINDCRRASGTELGLLSAHKLMSTGLSLMLAACFYVNNTTL